MNGAMIREGAWESGCVREPGGVRIRVRSGKGIVAAFQEVIQDGGAVLMEEKAGGYREGFLHISADAFLNLLGCC